MNVISYSFVKLLYLPRINGIYFDVRIGEFLLSYKCEFCNGNFGDFVRIVTPSVSDMCASSHRTKKNICANQIVRKNEIQFWLQLGNQNWTYAMKSFINLVSPSMVRLGSAKEARIFSPGTLLKWPKPLEVLISLAPLRRIGIKSLFVSRRFL